MVAVSTQTMSAAVCRPGTLTGSSAAAFATIPVPITEANQFGPRLANGSLGCSSSRNRRLAGRGGRASPAATVVGSSRVFMGRGSRGDGTRTSRIRPSSIPNGNAMFGWCDRWPRWQTRLRAASSWRLRSPWSAAPSPPLTRSS